MKRAWCASKW